MTGSAGILRKDESGMGRIFIHQKNNIVNPPVVLLMVICTLLNIMFSMVVRETPLPFYFDTVGTIVATALGGTVPGIITAFATNAINFFMDGESIFYAPLNMFIAVLASFFFSERTGYLISKKNKGRKEKEIWRRSVINTVNFILVLALVGGGIGGWITWYLYASPSDSPMIVALSKFLSGTFGIGVFGCHMISTYITDAMDKAISFAISMVIITTTPAKVKKNVRLSSWRQKEISFEEQNYAKSRLKGIPIGFRINLILIVSAFLVTAMALGFSLVSFRDNTIESLKLIASQTAYLASKEIDPDRVDAFIEQGYQASGYAKTMERLSVIKESSSDIAFLYVYKIEKDGCIVVFDLDTVLSDGTYVEGDTPGKVVQFEEAYKPFLDELLAGEKPEPLLMEDEYGSFLAAYCPVYDFRGNCVCYAVSNIEAGLVNQLSQRFIGRIILLLAGFLVLIIAISVLTTRYHVVLPILGMTVFAKELTETSEVNEESLSKLEDLDIHTGDEIEELYRSLCKLTGDTVTQLKDIRNKTGAISSMQNVLIITMADMVESRDSDTGAHVLKTAAYVRLILQGLKRNGYYAEKISDKFMRDVEMSAPLHDLGKINIPDAILNKPGKLTPEEFEIMKTHTTAGRTILEKAISSMEGDNYLKEARNMAAYHHERWDGKGYPEGLHGEVIPLSARIMAVADVFDALSSPRVYKPAFPFEEALKIIQESAGTQFDPKIVEVFIESRGEVRKILKKYQET